jgi:alpha-amylase
MPSVCFYFQVHQPYRLRPYSVFDIGRRSDYFDDALNAAILRRVADKCYLPMNALLRELVERFEGRFRVAFSISGTALEQFQSWTPEVADGFRALLDTGCVELLGETSHHSLSFLADVAEFDAQVDEHRRRIEAAFGVRPQVFRNTELILNNDLARHLERRDFRGALAEGADRVLGWRSPHFVYTAWTAPRLPLLLKSYRLSDDIAFRFGNRDWEGYPLTAEKFAAWIHATNGLGHVVNLFMDYETFGEHQWADTGIFEFMRRLPAEVLRHRDVDFLTPSEVLARYEPLGVLDVPQFVSWADLERDLSAWLDNDMQRAALADLYALRAPVVATGDPALLEAWRRLSTSDHFYYMCTKWFADGDVHKYFSPYESPYDAYIAFNNALCDLAQRAGVGPYLSSSAYQQ